MRRGLVLFLLVPGCAAHKAAPPPSAPAESASEASAGYPAAPPPKQEPAPAAEAPAKATTSDDAPGRSSSQAPATSGALSSSPGDLERAQRELEIAAGDCQNACRALGSMDRAAGKLCTLARSTDERDRCGDAKTKVQNARDRVRRTCGSCPDVTVDRNAAIPSR